MQQFYPATYPQKQVFQNFLFYITFQQTFREYPLAVALKFHKLMAEQNVCFSKTKGDKFEQLS
jgi:hypothetical protein